jgi:hypothetical protein
MGIYGKLVPWISKSVKAPVPYIEWYSILIGVYVVVVNGMEFIV